MKALKTKQRSPSTNSGKGKRSSSLKRSPSIPLIKKICEKEKEKLLATLRRGKTKSSSRDAKNRCNHANTISNFEPKCSPSSFNKLISNAKDLLLTQNTLIEQFDSLTKRISKSELEMEANDTNTEDLYNFNTAIESFKNKILSPQQKQNECEGCKNFQGFILTMLNNLNELIGKLGYNYVFHKFKPHNFNMENIRIYFSNTMNLLSFINKKTTEAYNIIQKQNEQLKVYENHILNLQKEINANMTNITNNNNSNCNYNITASNRTNNEVSLSSNLFTSNTNINLTSNNNMNPQIDNLNPVSNHTSTLEKTNEVIGSNMFDSGSFFEGYKRTKELKKELDLEHHYTEGNSVSQNYDDFRTSNNDIKMSTYNPKRSDLIHN